jgi:hypothetical protein
LRFKESLVVGDCFHDHPFLLRGKGKVAEDFPGRPGPQPGMIFFSTAEVMEKTGHLDQNPCPLFPRPAHHQPFSLQEEESSGLHRHLLHMVHSMSQVVFQSLMYDRPAFRNLRVFGKKGSREDEELAAAGVEAGRRKGSSNLLGNGGHFTVNISHDLSSEIKFPFPAEDIPSLERAGPGPDEAGEG